MEKGYLHCILTLYTFKICSFLHAFSISKVLFMSLIGKKKIQCKATLYIFSRVAPSKHYQKYYVQNGTKWTTKYDRTYIFKCLTLRINVGYFNIFILKEDWRIFRIHKYFSTNMIKCLPINSHKCRKIKNNPFVWYNHVYIRP